MNRERVPLRSFLFIIVAISLVALQVGARQDQKAPTPQAWDAGTRYPDWEAPSTLEIVNECNKEHSFTVTKKDADFLDFQFKQPILVPGHQSVTVPVRFHTDGMTPGIYNGLVTILCTDCTEVPPCMQDRRTAAPHIRILPRPGPGEGGTTPPTTEKPPPPVTPPGKPTGDSSTKEKIPATPHTAELKKGCCCCVDDLELRLKTHAKWFDKPAKVVWVQDEDEDWIQEPKNQTPIFGHEFKVILTYHKKRITDPKEEPGDCVLQWLERSDRPPASNVAAGAKPDVFNDVAALLGKYDPKYIGDGTTLGSWYKRLKEEQNQCPVPASPGLPPRTLELTDKPAILQGRHRTLEFHIIVASTPNCMKTSKDKDKDKEKTPCGKKELWAKQVLDTDPNNKDSKFYVSDDGENWTEAKRK